jgi:hypothetical protein
LDDWPFSPPPVELFNFLRINKQPLWHHIWGLLSLIESCAIPLQLQEELVQNEPKPRQMEGYFHYVINMMLVREGRSDLIQVWR